MYKKPNFKNRYRISGTLTAISPIHVGDGDNPKLSSRVQLTPDQMDTEYNSFATGVDGGAVIPGSTLKGVLRAWLERRDAPKRLIEAVFGVQEGDPTKDKGGKATKDKGGKAEFHDAPLIERAQGENNDRWWNATRGTCLAPGVSIDPRTRTAVNHLLYYTEFAPEGSRFRVTLTAQNLEDEERDLLLFAFEAGFGDRDDPVLVGAESGDGWGGMQWSDCKCEAIEKKDVETWLQGGASDSYVKSFRAVAITPRASPLGPAKPALLLDVKLQFQGAVLVNDPSQFRKRNENAGEPGVGHATVKRRNGEYILPGSSVRGALRAQARRIWQTLADGKAGDLNQAEQVDAKQSGDQRSLAAFYRMFGAPGWRTPVSVPDFELKGARRIHRQEFVAVDRFTGGAAEEKKFSAEGLYGPEFRGTITLDLAAWNNAAVGGWAIILLLFLLRDLLEGDVQFGFGASKGYGSCIAQISIRRRGEIPANLGGDALEDLVRRVVNREEAGLQNARLVDWEIELRDLMDKAA